MGQEVWQKADAFHMVSDPAALAEDLSAETSKLDLGAVVDTLAKTIWGAESISANTPGARRAELWGLPREMSPLRLADWGIPASLSALQELQTN